MTLIRVIDKDGNEIKDTKHEKAVEYQLVVNGEIKQTWKP